MKYAVDLHIHSVVSPCADKDMTPNNIVNMALLKGLDAIAVTDHNTGANLKAVYKCAKKAGLVFIPGMEVESSEEVHMVCLLPDLERAQELHDIVQRALPDIMNRPDIFGSQLIMDDNDEIIGEEPRMLLTATSLSVDDICVIIRKLGGAVIPAHVDRASYSIISNLGFIPEELGFKYIELSKECDKYGLRYSRPELDRYNIIKSSDAHYLGDILERPNILRLERLSAEAVIHLLA